MQDHVYISQGQRPFWHLCVAAAFYTGMLSMLYFGIRDIKDIPLTLLYLLLAYVFLLGGMKFSMSNGFRFEPGKERFREEIQIGPIKFGFWESMPSFQYVSIFKKAENYYQLNLWIENNDFYTIGAIARLEEAIESGISLGRQLEIDVLDAATDPRDSKWIELD